MEACLQSTSLTQLSSWFPRILLTLIPWGSLHSAGSGIAAVLQSVETGKLVVTLAIFATLTAAMANTIAKHRHYLFMQRPSRGIARCAKWNAHCTAESAAQPQTNPLTLAELLEHADQDGADRMVILVLAAPRLTWNSACGLTACLTKAWRVLTAINFSSVKTLEAQAALHQTTVVLDQMNQAHVQMVAELQETKVNKSSWINSLRAKLAVNTETTDAACQQSRLDAQAANVLEQQLQQAKEAKMRSHRRVSVLANMLNFTHRESNQTEERLTNAQILISGLEKSLTHAQQDRDANAVGTCLAGLHRGKLAAQKLRLEEVQQRRKHDKVKLQVQGDKVAKWQGEVRRLTNVVLHNNINSGKFFEACATVRSQRSGKVDPDLAAAAKALQAAAKAGRPFSSHTKANPTGTSRATISPLPAIKGQLRGQSKAAPAPPQAATGITLSHPPFTFASPAPHSLQYGHRAGSQPDSGPVFSSPAVARDQIPNSSWVLDSVLDGHDANVMFAPPQSQAVASACQAEVLSPSFDLDFLTNADLVRLDAHTLQHDAASITAKFEDSLHLLQPCSEMHEGISFMDESRITGLQQQQQPGFPSALYQSSQSYSVTSEDSPLASSGQGTSDDAPTTAHAWAPLGPDNSSEAAEGVKDLGASMHGTLSHLTFLDMEGILLGESP
ncbi:hypothetical protein WJX82_002238 [Trebouxia sp. C0006]